MEDIVNLSNEELKDIRVSIEQAQTQKADHAGDREVQNLQGQCQSRRLRKKMKKKKIGEQLEKMVSSS